MVELDDENHFCTINILTIDLNHFLFTMQCSVGVRPVISLQTNKYINNSIQTQQFFFFLKSRALTPSGHYVKLFCEIRQNRPQTSKTELHGNIQNLNYATQWKLKATLHMSPGSRIYSSLFLVPPICVLSFTSAACNKKRKKEEKRKIRKV